MTITLKSSAGLTPRGRKAIFAEVADRGKYVEGIYVTSDWVQHGEVKRRGTAFQVCHYAEGDTCITTTTVNFDPNGFLTSYEQSKSSEGGIAASVKISHVEAEAIADGVTRQIKALIESGKGVLAPDPKPVVCYEVR